MKTKSKNPTRDLIREAATWPSMREVASEYGIPTRLVRTLVDTGRVESIRLTCIRVNPASLEACLVNTMTRP